MDYQLTIHTPTDTATRTLTAEHGRLTQAVHGHVRGLLGSSRVTITLDPDTLTGTIANHGATAGTFTVEAAPPTARQPRDPMHGYTLRDIDQITRTAIQRRSAYSACDTDERYAAGWHAAVELLCTSTEPPTRHDLIRAAWDSADHETRRTAEHRGVGRSRGDGSRSDGATVKFWAYWNHTTPSPEAVIIERTALSQIWPRLTPGQQTVLQALAAHDDYDLAAAALGMTRATFYQAIHKARGRFLALWLEGETPRRGWRDRRHTAPQTQLHSVSAHIRKRRRAGAAA